MSWSLSRDGKELVAPSRLGLAFVHSGLKARSPELAEMKVVQCRRHSADTIWTTRLYRRGNDNAVLKDAIVKGDYDAAADTISATVEFEGEKPFDVTFSHDEHENVVWTVNGKSTVLTYGIPVD